jgi:hypothetical protein
MIVLEMAQECNVVVDVVLYYQVAPAIIAFYYMLIWTCCQYVPFALA